LPDRFGWRELTEEVRASTARLPEEERANAEIRDEKLR